jgi:hypothetical protein
MDLLYLLLAAALFGLSILFVRLCAHLEDRS